MHITQPKEFRFGEKSSGLKWSSFTDQVIGGFSTSTLVQQEEFIVMGGMVKPIFENGWSGMRSRKDAHDLSAYKFIEFKIKTDGKPYHFQMEHQPGWQQDKLGIVVDIVANQWKVMHIEMQDLKIYDTHKGFSNRKPKLDRKLPLIYRYNFMAAHNTPTNFNFQIEYLKFH